MLYKYIYIYKSEIGDIYINSNIDRERKLKNRNNIKDIIITTVLLFY